MGVCGAALVTLPVAVWSGPLWCVGVCGAALVTIPVAVCAVGVCGAALVTISVDGNGSLQMARQNNGID